jgi:hypothetical protein
MFRDSNYNIDELTTSISGFIVKCIGDVAPSGKVRCFLNRKPWINSELGTKIKDRATAQKAITEAMAEDRNKYKKSHYDLCRVMNQPKGTYRNKVESYYTGSEVRHMLQGLQSITDYKGRSSHDLPNDASLPDKLTLAITTLCFA